MQLWERVQAKTETPLYFKLGARRRFKHDYGKHFTR